jgi:hypothetical protein
MSAQNEMRKVRLTNLEHTVKRLRLEIGSLAKTICINLDTSLRPAEQLPISEADSQFDELKCKWAELLQTQSEINEINEALR